jgi:DNA-binding NtrC family response regulator
VPAEEFASLVRDDRHLEFPAAPLEDARTLLLVDDEEHILSSLKRLLRPDGYRILTATSAKDAMDLLALNDVQVIVSDQRMPEMNGTEFLRRVWQIYPDTIRILLTGYTEISSVMEPAVRRQAKRGLPAYGQPGASSY